MVKRIQSREALEINKYKSCVIRLAELNDQFQFAKNRGDNKELLQNIRNNINSEEVIKQSFVEQILKIRKELNELDTNFNLEIEYHMRRSNKWFIFRVFCCDWLKS